MRAARITVTLPPALLDEIDRRERNRSRFVLEAIRREVLRRRREDLRRSLASAHQEASVLAEAGLEEWGGAPKSQRFADLLDPEAGERVRWVEGEGWIQAKG